MTTAGVLTILKTGLGLALGAGGYIAEHRPAQFGACFVSGMLFETVLRWYL
jgi:hypothetical protein